MRSSLFALALSAVAVLGDCAAGSGGRVEVVVVNGVAEAPLACQLSLAHFVTRPGGEVAPGDRLTVPFQRDPGDGTLLLARDDGAPMAVEALICGVEGRWSETWTRVPLSRLRDGAQVRQRVTCTLAGRLSCVPAPP